MDLPGHASVTVHGLPKTERTEAGAIAAAVAKVLAEHGLEVSPLGATATPGANQAIAGECELYVDRPLDLAGKICSVV